MHSIANGLNITLWNMLRMLKQMLYQKVKILERQEEDIMNSFTIANVINKCQMMRTPEKELLNPAEGNG